MPAPLGDLSYTWPFIAATIGGYLFGSVPFGLILTRIAGLGDIRDIGSGNIGTLNVLRTGNKWLAALTLLFDAGKGAAAVLIAGRFGPDMAVLAGAGAVVGHLFPLWLRFRGGKGVATALGVLAALAWEVALLAVLTWLAIALIFRYGSLASMGSLASSPFYAVWLADPQRTELAGFMAILVILCHHANIRRLIKGEEPKIGRSAVEK